jgi:hypothetical protein
MKPTSEYEYMGIYYIIIVVNQLYIAVTFCGHLQGGVLGMVYEKYKPT